MLAINKPVAATRSESIMPWLGSPGYVFDANTIIAGKLNPVNTGAISPVKL
jgi:hypothetical protein